MGAKLATKDLHLPALADGMRQIDGLQVLRAFAALEVTWVHLSQDLARDGRYALPDLCVFVVDVFFVISVYIMTSILLRSSRTAGITHAWRFLRRRLLRIYPMFWISAALYLSFAVAHGFRTVNVLPTFLLMPMLHWPYTQGIIDQSWTLVFEMCFYAVLSAALLWTTRATQAASACLILLVLAGLVRGITHPLFIYFGNPMILEFVAGVWIALALAKVRLPQWAGKTLVLAGVLLASVLERWPVGAATGFQMIFTNQGVWTRVATWGIAAAMIVAGIVVWSPKTQSTVGRALLLLGNASYSLYLLGPLVGRTLARLLQPFDLWTRTATPWASALLVQTLLLGLTSAVSVAAYLWVEWPLVQRLQQRYGR